MAHILEWIKVVEMDKSCRRLEEGCQDSRLRMLKQCIALEKKYHRIFSTRLVVYIHGYLYNI